MWEQLELTMNRKNMLTQRLDFNFFTFMPQKNSITLGFLGIPRFTGSPQAPRGPAAKANREKHWRTRLCVRVCFTFERHWYLWESVPSLWTGSGLADASAWWDRQDGFVCVDRLDWDQENRKQPLLLSSSLLFACSLQTHVSDSVTTSDFTTSRVVWGDLSHFVWIQTVRW